MKKNTYLDFLENYRNIPIQAKASICFFVCSLIQKLISILSTIIFTRLMTTADYGLISVYNTWSDSLMIFASMNLSVGCFNVGMTKYEENQKTWVSTMQILQIICAIIFSFIILSTYHLWNNFVGLDFDLIVLMSITFLSIPALNLWTAKQKYFYNYRAMIYVSLSYSVLVLISSFIAVVNSNNKGKAKIIASSVVAILMGTGLLIKNIDFKKTVYQKEYSKFAFIYNLQMLPAFLSMTFLTQIDRIMIDIFDGRGHAGIYSVAYNAAIIVSIVAGVIGTTYNPWLMQKVKRKNLNNVNEIGIILSAGFIVIIFAFILLAPELVQILASNEYYEAIYVIPPVAASTYFLILYTLYSPVAQYYLKAKQLALITVFAAILNVLLNYICIKQWGYIAAGYTTYICYMVYGWGTGLYVNKIMKKVGLPNKLYNTKILALFSVILTCLVVLSGCLYYTYIIRYCILIILFILLICNWHRIIIFVKKIKGSI